MLAINESNEKPPEKSPAACCAAFTLIEETRLSKENSLEACVAAGW